MYLNQPSSTPYDICFQFGGTPVRIQPMFWLSVLLLGARGTPTMLLVFAVVMFLSVLVHELGHALVIRYFGWEPSIVLHGFGGVAMYHPSYRRAVRGRAALGATPIGQILIALAGPLAGFGLAMCIILGLVLANRSYPVDLTFFSPRAVWIVGRGPMLDDHPVLQLFVAYMLYFNIFWSLMNLLPILPLDGGRVAQQVLAARNGAGDDQQIYWLSTFAAGGFALWAVTRGETLIGIFFALLAYQNFQSLGRRGADPW